MRSPDIIKSFDPHPTAAHDHRVYVLVDQRWGRPIVRWYGLSKTSGDFPVAHLTDRKRLTVRDNGPDGDPIT